MQNINLTSKGRNLETRTNFNSKNSAIIFAHSFRNNFDIPICRDAELRFAAEGYTTLAFNFLGHGKSDGNLRDVSYKCLGENVSSAIEYLKKEGIKKIGFYGTSI